MNIFILTLYIRQRLCSLLGMLLLSLPAAAIQNNVTFTVKSNGALEARADFGIFDVTGTTLTMTGAELGSEFQNTSIVAARIDKYFWNPVGHNVSHVNSNNLNNPLKMRVRLKNLFINRYLGFGSYGEGDCGSVFNRLFGT